MKKFVKLLPIALAFILASPVFAENLAPGTATGQTSNASAELQLTLPPFIDITTQETNRTSSVTFLDDYSNITITTPMLAQFQVITNSQTGDAVQLTATAGNTAYNALRASSDNDFYLVFANTEMVPDEQSIISATSATPKSQENPNAFAVKITPNVDPVTNTGATKVTPNYEGTNKVKYPLTNGIYTFKYSLATTALDSTFSTLDTNGVYKSTMVLTQTTP